jgi:hypothetical protein
MQLAAPGPGGEAGSPAVTPTSCRVRETLERVGDRWSLLAAEPRPAEHCSARLSPGEPRQQH